MAVPKPLVRAGRRLSNGLYRTSGGRLMGRVRGMPVLLITVPGRKTGDPHTTPVLYFEDDGKFLVTGSGSGSVEEPQWFKNPASHRASRNRDWAQENSRQRGDRVR